MDDKLANKKFYTSKLLWVSLVSIALFVSTFLVRLYLTHLETCTTQQFDNTSGVPITHCGPNPQSAVENWGQTLLFLIAITIISTSVTLCLWHIKRLKSAKNECHLARAKKIRRSFIILSYVSLVWLISIIAANEVIKYNNNDYFLNDMTNFSVIIMTPLFLASTAAAITCRINLRTSKNFHLI